MSNQGFIFISDQMTAIFMPPNFEKVYSIFNDECFNDSLTNNTTSIEQLGPDIFPVFAEKLTLRYF